MRRVSEIGAKPRRRSKDPAAGLAPGPSNSNHPLLALQQTPQQGFHQLWTVGQQRADPPTAALQASTNTRSRVSPEVTQAGAGAITGAPANSAGPDPDPSAPGAPAVPPPHPLPLPARSRVCRPSAGRACAGHCVLRAPQRSAPGGPA